MISSDIRDRWEARVNEWDGLHVQVDGAAIAREVLADLERIANGSDEKPLTYGVAAQLSGYSADHIGRLVRGGKLLNVGRKGAPRVLAGELPRRPALKVAGPAKAAYDPVTDARSLGVRR